MQPLNPKGIATGVTLVTLLAAGCTAGAGEENPDDNPQHAFFDALSERCGEEYPGRAIIAPETDLTFRPAYLAMQIASCTDSQIRIPFIVDGDASRTWVLTLDDDGLLFTHEHLLDGDTLSSNSGWGGRAPAGSGTALFQHFPDHRWAPDRVPEENRSHWRMRIDPDHGQFVYYLDRGTVPAYRLVFHMGQDPLLSSGM